MLGFKNVMEPMQQQAGKHDTENGNRKEINNSHFTNLMRSSYDPQGRTCARSAVALLSGVRGVNATEYRGKIHRSPNESEPNSALLPSFWRPHHI